MYAYVSSYFIKKKNKNQKKNANISTHKQYSSAIQNSFGQVENICVVEALASSNKFEQIVAAFTSRHTILRFNFSNMETKRVDDRRTPRANVPCMEANKPFWSEFFELYKNLPSLWYSKHPDYSHRDAKALDYNKLINKLKELYPDANRELVVKKINNYRTSFRKELLKVRKYKREGIEYTPTIWYFNNLSFLIDQVQLHGIKSEIIQPAVEVKN